MLRVPAAKAPCTNGAESAMAAGAKAAVLRTLRRVSGLGAMRSEEHTSELQSQSNLVCRLLLEKKKQTLPQLRPQLAKFTFYDPQPLTDDPSAQAPGPASHRLHVHRSLRPTDPPRLRSGPIVA